MPEEQRSLKKPAVQTEHVPSNDPFASGTFDIERLASNLGRAVELGGKALAEWMRPREQGRQSPETGGEFSDIIKTMAALMQYWFAEPQRATKAQADINADFMALFTNAAKRLNGEKDAPVATPDSKDRRFSDEEWTKNVYFDFIKQGYLLTARWAEKLARQAEGLDPHTRHKADFYMRQITAAFSPSNYLPTNPTLIRDTLRENGANLVRGLTMLAEDIRAGGGNLKLRQSDTSKFQLGVNIALTPGKVVYRNDTIELLQYSPTTESVFKRPLLISPPWINKFYILDLTPEKSFIRWCVDQGLTVFVISWVNPDERHRDKGFLEYIKEGPVAALDEIGKITGEKDITTIGYCVGGTLLAVALAYMAAKGDTRVSSSTFFTTQVDFEFAGDLKVFVDEEQVSAVERDMQQSGYLPGSRMAGAFNMLRSQELLWPYFVNAYMFGKQPLPFDLLYWNADATRMPQRNHSFYLRNCYLENKLSKGEMELDGMKLDLSKVEIPIYNLATREDHIAPAKSVFVGSKSFGGKVDYVLSGSGHIAGVVNPPSKNKYQYWTGGPVQGEYEAWLETAEEHPGSWWPHWLAWIEAQAPEKISASKRKPGGRRKPLEDAPGTYVKIKA